MSEDEDIQDEDTYDDLDSADEDRLRHEIKYLRERLTNLEGFKRMFFALRAEGEKSLDAHTMLENQTQALLKNQKKSSQKIVKATHEAITVIEESIDNQIMEVNGVYSDLEKELCQAFSDIGLSDQFKEMLLEVLKGNKNKLNVVLTQILTLDQHFVEIIAKLEKAYGATEEQGKKPAVDID